MVTWDDFNNSKNTTKKVSTAWDNFNKTGMDRLSEKQSVSQKVIEPSLYKSLANRGTNPYDIAKNFQKPTTIKKEFPKSFGETVGKAVKTYPAQVFSSAQKMFGSRLNPFSTLINAAETIRAERRGETRSVQDSMNVPSAKDFKNTIGQGVNIAVSTPAQVAELGALEGVAPLINKYGDVTMKQNLESEKQRQKERIKETLLGQGSLFTEYQERADNYLKFRAGDTYGTSDFKPTKTDVAAVVAMGAVPEIVSWLTFSIPASKLINESKHILKYKKVRQVERGLAEGQKFVNQNSFEIAKGDLKVRFNAKDNSVVIKGYQKRIPSQKALGSTKASAETTDLLMKAREASGMELTAKFIGDDLKIVPKYAIKQTPNITGAVGSAGTKAVNAAGQTLAQEAKKYKSANEFVKAQDILYHRTNTKFDEFNVSLDPDETGTWFAKDKKLIDESAKEFPILMERIPNKKLNLITEKKLSNIENSDAYLDSNLDTASFLKSKGFDGIDYQDGNIQLFNPNEDTIPKSQLEEIWNKAQEQTELLKKANIAEDARVATEKTEALDNTIGKTEPLVPTKPDVNVTPEIKKSKLGLRVEQDAVEKGLSKGFEDLPEYEVMNMKEQSKLATDLINEDFEKAKKIALGAEEPEGKLRKGSVYVAMKNYAKETSDVNLMLDLARSDVVSKATFYGQEIKALDDRDPFNPIKAIREIEKNRAESKGAVKPKEVVKKKLTVEEKRLKHEIKMVKKYDKELEDFINSIKC